MYFTLFPLQHLPYHTLQHAYKIDCAFLFLQSECPELSTVYTGLRADEAAA